MKMRPRLRPGDVVKLSKKGKIYTREFPMRTTLVVSDIVEGDGAEKSSVISCRTEVNREFRFYKFFRSELWHAGINVFNKV